MLGPQSDCPFEPGQLVDATGRQQMDLGLIPLLHSGQQRTIREGGLEQFNRALRRVDRDPSSRTDIKPSQGATGPMSGHQAGIMCLLPSGEDEFAGASLAIQRTPRQPGPCVLKGGGMNAVIAWRGQVLLTQAQPFFLEQTPFADAIVHAALRDVGWVDRYGVRRRGTADQASPE
ncbi:hypothetical protein DBY65_014370 [Pseudomonas sp. RIT412]|nr:hypothetical protein DBP26_021015 [Pseudomonas sp. RIT 409]RAU53401.1 hypothetical protein DBY65_014370 [Pseudomonas sp. RIT 412]